MEPVLQNLLSLQGGTISKVKEAKGNFQSQIKKKISDKSRTWTLISLFLVPWLFLCPTALTFSLMEDIQRVREKGSE